MVLGADGAGVVEGAGEGARRFSRGDELFGQLLIAPLGSAGTYAEYVAVTAQPPPTACAVTALRKPSTTPRSRYQTQYNRHTRTASTSSSIWSATRTALPRLPRSSGQAAPPSPRNTSPTPADWPPRGSPGPTSTPRSTCPANSWNGWQTHSSAGASSRPRSPASRWSKHPLPWTRHRPAAPKGRPSSRCDPPRTASRKCRWL